MAEAGGNRDQKDGSRNQSTVLEVTKEVPFRPRTDSDLLRRIIGDRFLRSVRNYNNDGAIIENTIRKLSCHLEKIEKSKKNADSKVETNSDRTREILQNLSPRYKDRYKVLQKRIAKWKPKREASIQKLTTFISKLDWNSKASTLVRLIASSVDVSGSVGGLLFRSEESWTTHALSAASFCGLCGLVSTVAEVEMSKRILDEVSDIIESDLKLLAPVVKWFEDTEELDSAVQVLFPYGIDKTIVQEIQEDSEEQDEYLQIFKAVLLSNVRRDTTLLSNGDFLHSLQLFARSEVAPLWWNRIMYRRHPIILDFSRMALQMEFGQIQSIIFQCIPALPLEQQRLASLPVAGRIMLNLLTMYDSLADLNKGARSMHSDKLRRHVEKMTEELEVIEDTVRKMEPHTQNVEDGSSQQERKHRSI